MCCGGLRPRRHSLSSCDVSIVEASWGRPRAVGRSETPVGVSSNLVGIICPNGWNRVNWSGMTNAPRPARLRQSCGPMHSGIVSLIFISLALKIDRFSKKNLHKQTKLLLHQTSCVIQGFSAFPNKQAKIVLDISFVNKQHSLKTTRHNYWQ